MSAMQKFKLLATQCAIAGSPTRSPTTSPVIHLRRRKTLRMLLGRTIAAGGGRGSNCSGRRRLPSRFEECSPDRPGIEEDDDCSLEKKKTRQVARHKLKDLFVSSPPLEERVTVQSCPERQRLLPPPSATSDGNCSGGGSSSGYGVRSIGSRSLRPLSATFRQRLRRRAWRPVLLTIPE